MPRLFFGQEIQVKVEGELRQPAAFTLEGRERVISEVLEAWADHGFGNVPLQRKHWWQRHHRNYYRVRTAEGELFELYYDRGASLKSPQFKRWYVSRQLDADEARPWLRDNP